MMGLIALLLLPALSSFAQSNPPTRPKIEVEAERYSAQNDDGFTRIEGGKLAFGGYELMSPLILFNPKSRQIKAPGTFTLSSSNLWLSGENLWTDAASGAASLENLAFYDSTANLYLKAKLAKGNLRSMELQDVTLTSCNPETPGWEVWTSSLTYHFENYAFGWHLVFFMEEAPLVYLPFFGFPTVTKRSSGFLAPQFSYKYGDDVSKAYGARVKLPFFLAFRQDNDLTLTADIIQRRGVAADADYNYAFTKSMSGQLKYWSLKESAANRTAATESDMSDEDTSKPARSQLIFSHVQSLSDNQQIFFQHINNSDNEVRREYFGSNISYDLEHRTTGEYILSWKGGYAGLSADEHVSFTKQSIYNKSNNSETVASRMPELIARHTFYDFLLERSYLDAGTRYTQFNRKQGWKGGRSWLDASLTYSGSLDFVNILVSASVDKKNYAVQYSSNNLAEDAEEERKRSFEQTFRRFKAASDFNVDMGWGAEPDSHFVTMTPALSFDYREDVEQRDSLGYLPGEELSETQRDYARFAGMFDDDDKVLGYMQAEAKLNFTGYFWDLGFSSIYDLWRKDTTEDTEKFFKGPTIEEVYRESPLGEKRLPYRITGSLRPISWLSLSAFSRYDTYQEQDKFIEHRFTARLGGKDFISASTNTNLKAYKLLDGTLHNKTDSITLNAAMESPARWKASVYAIFDRLREPGPNDLHTEMTKAGGTIKYIHPCYIVGVTYKQSISEALRNGVNKEFYDREIELIFELKSL